MGSTVEELRENLSSALGSRAVDTDSGVCLAHQIDGVTPSLVITPDSAEQIGAALGICSKARAAVIPWGGGTAMALGNPPRRADAVLKLDRLNRVIEHDAANLTVTAQCGMTLDAIQTALAGKKQFIAIDAPLPARATLGGIVAANLNGPRRSCYGSVRDLVIGMKVITATGESIKAGGKVVKNVAGYDMCKLFVGSLGTLGIIAEITLRVAPVAQSAATWIGDGTASAAQRMIEELARSPLLPAAMFVRSEGARQDWRVAVWCEGFAETLRRQIGELEAIASHIGLQTEILKSDRHAELWRRIGDVPLQPGRVVYRVTLPRAAVFDFLKQVSRRNPLETVSDAAVGTIWLSFPATQDAMAQFAEIDSLARAQRGHVVVFSAPAMLKKAINTWGPAPAALSLMRDVKNQFDPQGILNPGRFVGNL